MSIETAMAALNPPVPPQQQSLTKQEVTSAISEAETKPAVVEPTIETKPTETAKPKEEPASAKFSALAKKEKAIVTRSNELKAKEASFAEREAKIAAREAKIKESESLWDTDVFKALEARGYTYNKLTELALEG